MLVGAKAKRMAELYPQNTVVSVKRKIGDPKFKYTIFGKKYTPVDISAFIIQKLVQGAEEYLGEKIEDAVITVPARDDTEIPCLLSVSLSHKAIK